MDLAIKDRGWISKPLGIWHVGEQFGDDELRIIFVGKPHRGEPWAGTNKTRYSGSNLLVENEHSKYAIAENRATELYHKASWPYWLYTKEIVTRIYGDEKIAWDKIGFTNLVKCTVSDNTDHTLDSMKQNCVMELGVIWKELEVLKAKNVILYLGPYYDYCISNEILYKYLGVERIDEKTDSKWSIPVGQKRCLWWDRQLFLKTGGSIRFLRVSHPERMKKFDYVEAISNWLKQR
jgi:hypothetical protein